MTNSGIMESRIKNRVIKFPKPRNLSNQWNQELNTGSSKPERDRLKVLISHLINSAGLRFQVSVRTIPKKKISKPF